MDFRRLLGLRPESENPFEREGEAYGRAYPSGWRGMPPAGEQVERLEHIFSSQEHALDQGDILRQAKRLQRRRLVEGVVVAVKVSAVQRLTAQVVKAGKRLEGWGLSSAGEDLNDPWGKDHWILLNRVFTHHFDGHMAGGRSPGRCFPDSGYYPVEAEWWKELEDDTPGDFVVVPWSFGRALAGHSEAGARWEANHMQAHLAPAWFFIHAAALAGYPSPVSNCCTKPLSFGMAVGGDSQMKVFRVHCSGEYGKMISPYEYNLSEGNGSVAWPYIPAF
jgi:hypothetical protein